MGVKKPALGGLFGGFGVTEFQRLLRMRRGRSAQTPSGIFRDLSIMRLSTCVGTLVLQVGAWFSLCKRLQMSKEEMTAHAKRYSQSFQKQYGVWFDNFESMAHKTAIKLLLSRFAPLSIDSQMQRAIESDSAILQDSGVAYYPDNSQDFEAIEVDQLSE